MQLRDDAPLLSPEERTGHGQYWDLFHPRTCARLLKPVFSGYVSEERKSVFPK